jgi:hypothetical protein
MNFCTDLALNPSRILVVMEGYTKVKMYWTLPICITCKTNEVCQIYPAYMYIFLISEFFYCLALSSSISFNFNQCDFLVNVSLT